MSNSNDEFQLMLKQIDMETQIVEYQDFISGNFSLKNSSQALLDIIGNTNAIIDFVKSTKPLEVYDVSIKDKVSGLLKDGKVRLGKLKDGSGFMPNFVANEPLNIDGKIYNENQIVAQARLNVRDITPDMANAINNCIVNMQLTRINAKIEEVNTNLGDIQQGQRNDRIALVYSAEEQMKEALATKDEALRKLLVINAISTANDARFQLMETLKTDRYKFLNDVKSANILEVFKSSAEITAKNVDEIKSAFFYINMSTSICAQGYMLLDEKESMLKSIDVYKEFVKDMFIENSVMNDLHLYSKNTDTMWLDKPKEIYETLNNFSIKCSDNLKLQDDDKIHVIDEKIKVHDEKSNSTKRYVIENRGNKSYIKIIDVE